MQSTKQSDMQSIPQSIMLAAIAIAEVCSPLINLVCSQSHNQEGWQTCSSTYCWQSFNQSNVQSTKQSDMQSIPQSIMLAAIAIAEVCSALINLVCSQSHNQDVWQTCSSTYCWQSFSQSNVQSTNPSGMQSIPQSVMLAVVLSVRCRDVTYYVYEARIRCIYVVYTYIT